MFADPVGQSYLNREYLDPPEVGKGSVQYAHVTLTIKKAEEAWMTGFLIVYQTGHQI